MPDQAGEKSQEPTQHRRQQARDEGQVVKSQDLGSAVILIAALVLILWLGGNLMVSMKKILRAQISGEAWLTTDMGHLMSVWNGIVDELATTLLPLLALILLVAVLTNIFQIGFMFLPDKLIPNFSHISITKGLGRIFSLPSVARLGFGLFKIGIIATVVSITIYNRWEEIVSMAALDIQEITMVLVDVIFWTAIKIAIALLILALFDYAFQKWKHEQDLKMTNQEVREEMKNLQGDPQILQRRRAVQRQMLMNNLGDAVPKADVVVTNPTELAVAIQYDPQQMIAPIVVAKGAGMIAQRIRRLALENDIPIVENKPLARGLYAEVEINHPVSDKDFGAVAEVLAYVYQLKGKKIPGADQQAA